jgi:hypothetical protein
MTRIYQGQIEHNRQTIRALFKVTYYKYEMKKVAGRFLAGSILTVMGLIGKFPFIIQGILLLTGCWLLVSKDFPSKCKADRALEARKQQLPTVQSTFYEDYVELSSNGKMKIRYNEFEYLLEENEYIFLFLDRDSVCMIVRDTLEPNDYEAFKKFIQNKTTLKWEEHKPFWNMSLMELLQLIKK